MPARRIGAPWGILTADRRPLRPFLYILQGSSGLATACKSPAEALRVFVHGAPATRVTTRCALRGLRSDRRVLNVHQQSQLYKVVLSTLYVRLCLALLTLPTVRVTRHLTMRGHDATIHVFGSRLRACAAAVAKQRATLQIYITQVCRPVQRAAFVCRVRHSMHAHRLTAYRHDPRD